MKATAWARSSPIFISWSRRVKLGFSKPAICSCSLTVSVLAIEKGPGPQVGSSVSSGSSRYRSTTCLGAVDPVVIELAPPDHCAEPAPGAKRAANVPQGLHRVREEHDTHPRERVVKGPGQFHHLDIAGEELDVLDPGLARLLDRGPDERLRDVDADDLALRTDQSGELLGRVAEAAADVQDPVSGVRRVGLHRGLAEVLQADDDQVAVLDETVEEHPAPGLGGFLVLSSDLARARDDDLLHGAMVRGTAQLLGIGG